MNQFSYRLDTNFAKMDRIDHPEIEEFKTAILAHEERGRSLSAWVQLLKALNDDKNPTAQEQAAQIIQQVYNSL